MIYVASIVAFLIGMIFVTSCIYSLLVGKMVVYIPDMDDELPCLSAELDRSISFIEKRKYILFKVDVRNLITQK